MEKIILTGPENHAVISQQTPCQRGFSETLSSAGAQQQQIDWLNLHRTTDEDRTVPQMFSCSWRYDGAELTDPRVEIAEDSGFRKGLFTFTPVPGERTVRVHSLKAGTGYYWRVTGTAPDGGTAVSDIREFRTMDEVPRWIYVEGVSNVRDIGFWKTGDGRRVRQGLLYRGGEMNHHMTASEAGLRFLEKELGIRCVLDIREEGELAKVPTHGPALPASVRWINYSLAPYARIFQPEQMSLYASAFRTLLDEENLPMYVHCWGGADRTGTLIFLLNAVLGVESDSLLKDYELTSLSIWDTRSRTSSLFREFEQGLASFAPDGDYGAAAVNYFIAAGISEAEIRKFKSLFL